MKQVFIGTSGWLAVLIISDFHHANAVDIYLRLLSSGHDLKTHDGILLEMGNALSGIRTRKIAKKLIDTIAESKRIELVPLTPQPLETSWNLFSERADKNWGIVDCISFVLMRQLGISEALTADQHFEQAGFFKLL